LVVMASLPLRIIERCFVNMTPGPQILPTDKNQKVPLSSTGYPNLWTMYKMSHWVVVSIFRAAVRMRKMTLSIISKKLQKLVFEKLSTDQTIFLRRLKLNFFRELLQHFR
jgi:flagellar biosynthesis protein FliQ